MKLHFLSAIQKLVKSKEINLDRLVELMTSKPAMRLGLPVGSLKIGTSADVNIIDLNKEYTIEPESFETKGKTHLLKDGRFMDKSHTCL